MAKQSMIQRNIQRKKLVNRYIRKRHVLLNKLKYTNKLTEIFTLQRRLQRLPGNSLPIRIKNRCWKTGRCRGFYRDFGLSRHVLREMAHQCLLPGVIKSSW
jgi:small subunit ribosomal protein S14